MKKDIPIFKQIEELQSYWSETIGVMCEQNFAAMEKLWRTPVLEFYRQYDLWEKIIRIKTKAIPK